MAVSGSTDFELDVADYIEEAFERCGIEVRTGYDLAGAKWETPVESKLSCDS